MAASLAEGQASRQGFSGGLAMLRCPRPVPEVVRGGAAAHTDPPRGPPGPLFSERRPMIDDVVNELREAVGKTHESLRRNLSKVRTGRASAQMLAGVRVDYYGASTPLSQ